jgi:hypothetical protein
VTLDDRRTFNFYLLPSGVHGDDLSAQRLTVALVIVSIELFTRDKYDLIASADAAVNCSCLSFFHH